MPRKSDDGRDTFWSPEERLWALGIAGILSGFGYLAERIFGHGLIVKIVGFPFDMAIFYCLWVAVVGRMSDD